LRKKRSEHRNAIKIALLNEFKTIVNSKQIQEQLSKSKRAYLYRMKDLTICGDTFDSVLIQYVIDGVEGNSIDNTLFYAARVQRVRHKERAGESLRPRETKAKRRCVL